MIKEAIILAGGLGTRLRSVVADVPKCMAPVAGKPFLSYIIDSLIKQGITKFIFSVGYKSEIITAYLEDNYKDLDYQLAIEDHPLGTGGAIYTATLKASAKNILILNGDTFFNVDLNSLYNFHGQKNETCSLALKPMKDFSRYGVVEVDDSSRITSFLEKQFYTSGNINGGVYLLNKEKFFKKTFQEVFSFEKDYLEKYFDQIPMYGFISNGYFIDIGIPEDFEKAQKDFSNVRDL